MNQIVKSSKKILRGFVENTPILRDLYYYHWLFPRNPNLYRGFFGSFAEGFDIFLTCGTLQYLEPSLSELLSKLQSQPQHLIINHVPF